MILQRRDIPPVLLMLLLIVLVMLTLSQILVVHNGRYGRNIHNMRKLQLELREMDINLHSLMMQNVPSIELNRRLLQNEINAVRIKAILAQASKTERKPRWTRRRNQTAPSTQDPTLDPTTTKSTPRSPPEGSNASSPLTTKTQVKYCPAIPPGLKGRVFTRIAHSHNYSEAEIIRQNPELHPGGQWRPEGCTARHKVAVIVPYRDRKEHLRILLSHLHPILQRQQLDYTIFVVEQYGKDTFNKARIMNIAFIEALKLYPYQCFVFHDVDLVPEDDRNMYSCPTQPRHMSVAIDEMGYKLAYQELVGGVLNLRTEHFQRVNGYSNLYWGWGAEDDDMAYRIMHVGLKITRPPEVVARYKMIRHTKRKPADWRKRAKLLYTGTRRFQFDGLNSLQYRMVRVDRKPLFTHLLVDIGKPPRGF